MGNFFSVFLRRFFSRFHKTKTRTFKKNLRHGFLHPDLNSMPGRFQWLNKLVSEIWLAKDFKKKNSFFIFLVNFQKHSFPHINVTYIIRLPYNLFFNQYIIHMSTFRSEKDNRSLVRVLQNGPKPQ